MATPAPRSEEKKLRASRKRRWWLILFILVVLCYGVTRIPWVNRHLPKFGHRNETVESKLVQPTRGMFLHEIAVRGDISSSSNVDIKCDVRSQSGVMILSVIPEGTTVKKGEILAQLDSSQLIESRVSQVNTVATSEAELSAAENDLKTAKIAKEEYENGSYQLSMQEMESSQIAAVEERDRLAEYLEHSKKLYAKGFITKSQYDADEFALKQAELKLKSANLKITVLKEYTHSKELINHDSSIRTAEAKYSAKKNVHQQNLDKLKDIESQIDACTIRAPGDGKVLYVNETNRMSNNTFIVEEGASVRERQVFLRLPDPNKLQVVTDVHEGKINYIKVGQPVVVHTDATGEMDVHGEVIKVNELPQPTNMWMGNVKEYRVTIQIDPTPGVLPGMTADTRVLVDKQENVLMVPTHTVFEHGGKYYCIVSKSGVLEPRELELGANNDKVVIVLKGLEGTEKLLSAAFDSREKVALPALAEGQTASATIRQKFEEKPASAEKKRGPRGMRPNRDGRPDGMGAPGTPGAFSGEKPVKSGAKMSDDSAMMPPPPPDGGGNPPPPPPGEMGPPPGGGPGGPGGPRPGGMPGGPGPGGAPAGGGPAGGGPA